MGSTLARDSYSVRPGDIANGNDYEFMTLRLVSPNVEEAGIIFNPDSCSDFEDMEIYKKLKGLSGGTVSLVQLKHQTGPRNIQLDFLKDKVDVNQNVNDKSILGNLDQEDTYHLINLLILIVKNIHYCLCCTAIHRVARYGQNAIELLLLKGLHVNFENNDIDAALHEVAPYSRFTCFERKIQHRITHFFTQVLPRVIVKPLNCSFQNNQGDDAAWGQNAIIELPPFERRNINVKVTPLEDTSAWGLYSIIHLEGWK